MSTEASRLSARVWLLFLAGPVIWAVHFMGVYLLAEAACAAGGFSRELLGLPLLSTLTLLATVAAVIVAVVTTVAAYRHWRRSAGDTGDWIAGSELNPGLTLAGFLLGIMFIVSILVVGLPAAFLEPC